MIEEKKMKPHRIAHIIGKMCAGGVESVAFNYYRAIDHTKYQFDFYYDEDSVSEPPRELIDMGARFFKLPPYQKTGKYIRALREHLREKKYKIVHSHLNTISVFPLYAAWRERISIRIAHNHSVPAGSETLRNIIKAILKRFSKLFANKYFACSEKAGRWLFGNRAYSSGKVFIMKNAIDFNKFRTEESRKNILKSELGLADSFVVGHVGRFTYAKNHLFLLEIFSKILEFRSDARLLLVGDGELREKILQRIKELNIESKVIFTGRVKDPEHYYSVMNVAIFPSFFEGLPLTAIECQVTGVPIVLSKAVPKEAVISDACAYRDLNDSPINWAQTALNLADCAVVLNKAGRAYDIEYAVAALEKQYDSMLS